MEDAPQPDPDAALDTTGIALTAAERDGIRQTAAFLAQSRALVQAYLAAREAPDA
ncbi:hypothetical protein GEU84_004840 [Fertoebacter nigrum]|uniref:Uncharacterized protein n=1 Tax=Fertoeibacter niger TaxID=2656921 RepID=A0A8X8H192_9RHOB|nr:hypothetical protein [Fertoeibacter niger]NUB43703.1 hypothetical protein [Fertoeibacter niger]